MIPHGAASLPQPGGSEDRQQPPGLDELRAALRPPELPRPWPRGVLEAADRVADLVHAEQYREAFTLLEAFRDVAAPPAERIVLLRAGLEGAWRTGDVEEFERTAGEMTALLRASGHSAQAEATAAVLREPDRHGRRRGPGAAMPIGAPSSPAAPRRGRRRGAREEVSAELLAVVQGLVPADLQGEGQQWPQGPEPHREVRRMQAALESLPAVREQILGEPEPLLRLRLAQALEGAGDHDAASTLALDVLEMLAPGEVQQPVAGADPERLATAAHAVLARTLGTSHPLQAIGHALDALETIHGVDDPPLRIGLITDLLRALMQAGATAQASFTAGRLVSLQRTLRRDSLRIAPLLAVATQRMHAGRYEAAMVPLEQARAIARAQRDRYGSLEAARLAASVHDRAGDLRACLPELQQMAADARWLADDLATVTAQRPALVRTELEARALVMRRALDLGETAVAQAAAELIDRRAGSEQGTPGLPPELLWDHRVDARVGSFIAVGAALGRGEEGIDEHQYEQRRREAMVTVDQAPAGHDGRARYWAAYLDDRHAEMLAACGQETRALRAARRARDGWRHLGSPEDVTRLDQLIVRLETPSTR